MSQKKVDDYKYDKEKRAKMAKREERIFMLEKIGIGIVLLGMVAWIGYSTYDLVTREDPKDRETTVTEMDVTAMTDYLQGLSAGDTVQ